MLNTVQQDQQKRTMKRIRRGVPSAIAANVREEDEALAATIETAHAMAKAAADAANAMISRARARHDAAMRPILRALRINEGQIVATDGFGRNTTITIETPQENSDA